MRPNTIPIAGFPILEATPHELVDYLMAMLRAHKKATLFYANTNFIVKCRHLLGKFFDDSVIIVNDGFGLDLAARLCRGRSFKSNLNGTDFTPYMLRQSTRPLRVYLYGGKPEVVSRAAHYVANQLGQIVVGFSDGYQDHLPNSGLIHKINQSGAEVLLVALGNPLQEQWIMRYRDVLQVGLVTGVGALFDFWAGDKPRAPKLIQRLRMEWFYRLCLEPRRLIKRYTLDILVFFATCLKYRKS
ncbi:MAG TPA: WecB/TagA/CpsF family glycosyltransferase [Methylophilaceae bacterium]|jgi:beta-1,4-glucosyltransferase